jgi:lysozyme family protein
MLIKIVHAAHRTPSLFPINKKIAKNQTLGNSLKHEGGWSDDPADPGGATNYGITLKTAQRHGIATKQELKVISRYKVEAIYYADYWRFDGINNQRVATKLFDMAVNMGLSAAVRLVQKAVVMAHKQGTLAKPHPQQGKSVDIDGQFGPLTALAINSSDPAELLKLLCDMSADRYRAIADNRPASQKFLKGWLKRASEVPNA